MNEAPVMPVAGEETRKLATLFAMEATWKGHLLPGALSPDSPELPTTGHSTGKAIADGFWYTVDMEVTMGTGESAPTWKGHLVVGWDANANGYQALLTDNVGVMVQLNCELTGTKFIATAVQPLLVMGQMTSARFTWDFSNPNAIKWTDEHQVDGGPWHLWEEEVITPVVK